MQPTIAPRIADIVYFANRTRGSGLRAAPLRRTLQLLLHALEMGDASVSLTLVRDRDMQTLNAAHRGKDAPTDVLSFPLFDPAAFDRRAATVARTTTSAERLLGDIVISVDTAQRQARAYDASLEREVERLLVHGVLHLCGHDHMEPRERVLMEREERRLADAIGLPWPYSDDVPA